MMNNRIIRIWSAAASLIVTHRTRRPDHRIICTFARLASAALIFVAITQNARANLVYVDEDAPVGGNGTSWATAFKHLQDGLAATMFGDEIRVAGGTYRPDQDEAGNITPGDRFATFQLQSGVALNGGYAGFGAPDPNLRDMVLHTTILSGDLGDNDGPNFAQNDENAYHVLTGNGVTGSAILDGCTVTGGNANDDMIPYDAGGGIRTQAGAPTITKCTFMGNSATFGGGMENFDDGNPSVSDCIFVANRATHRGGAVHNNISNPTFTDCIFHENIGMNSGGGMRNLGFGGPTLIRCQFIENHAGFGGGMVNDESFALLLNCIFRGNTAEGSSGGLHNWISNPELTNCLFVHNSAVTVGAAIYNINNSNPSLTNCTVTRNDAGSEGGGLYSTEDSSALLTNSIVWDNPGGAFAGPGVFFVTYSDIQGEWLGMGNIAEDPKFRDPGQVSDNATPDNPDDDFWVDDLRLMSGSPCIGAGDPNFEPQPGETDLDGQLRLRCDQVDMGAYEFGLGDYQCDGDVDLFDFANWADCLTGPEKGPFAERCEPFDFDADLDIDLDDYGEFLQVFISE